MQLAPRPFAIALIIFNSVPIANAHDIKQYLLGDRIYHQQTDLINKSGVSDAEKIIIKPPSIASIFGTKAL